MGDQTELQTLEALLDEWTSASVGVRRSLERRLFETLDAMDPGSVPARIIERMEVLRISARGVRTELPTNAIFVPFVDEDAGGLVAAVQVHEDGLYESALQAKMTPECLRACVGAIRLAAHEAERRTAGDSSRSRVARSRSVSISRRSRSSRAGAFDLGRWSAAIW
jgi:hypothetical protein